MNDYVRKYIKECKYASVQKGGTVYCKRDGSIRRRGCPCNHHCFTLWAKIKHKLGF